MLPATYGFCFRHAESILSSQSVYKEVRTSKILYGFETFFSGFDRIQHIQLGFGDGIARSYIYPYLDVDYCLGDEPPTLACRTKPNDPIAVFLPLSTTIYIF